MKRPTPLRIAVIATAMLLATSLVVYGQGRNGFDVWPGSLDLETYSGAVLVNDAGQHPSYALDADSDGIADYHLSFGPWWYEPASGAVRPIDGQLVTIVAALWECEVPNTLMVFEIDGETWRESGRPAPWAGGWVSADAAATSTVILGNDPNTWIEFGPGAFGAMNSGHHFVEFWPVHPDWLPGELNRERQRAKEQNGDPACDDACEQERERQRQRDQNQIQTGDPACDAACEQERERQRQRERQHFGGFHLDVFDEQGNRPMPPDAGTSDSPIQLRSRSRFQMRYDEQERLRRRLSGEEIGVRYWNRERQEWEDVPGVTVDLSNHLVTFSSDLLFSYYAVYAYSMPQMSTATEAGDELPATALLGQNYPNPFNPVTVLPFKVPSTQRVVLTVYDALGAEVATLLDGMVPAGSHIVRFHAGTLPTGAYLYAIRGEGWREARLMMLVR